MRISLLALVVLMAACSRSDANPLTQSDWTNGQQPCSENRMSFRDGRMAYYPKGSQPLVMFNIVSMNKDSTDPSLTDVVVAPTPAVVERAKVEGKEVPSNYSQMLLFRVEGERLNLVATARADGSNRLPANAIASGDMRLVRCSK